MAMESQTFLTLTLLASCLIGVGQTPKPADPERQAALTLELQGSNVEAETAWRAFSKAHPSNPEPYAHLGLLEARQEHYQAAIPLYRKALALGPKIPRVQLNLGLALFKNEELKAAAAEFESLSKILPADSPQAEQITILLGMAHYGQGEYADAAPFLKSAALRDPQNLPLRLALAHCYLWTRQFQSVMDVYREILALNAESAEADMLAGEAMDEMKDNAGATKMFRAAVKANPKEPNAHFALGYLLWSQKQYKEAASEFQAELGNDPDHIQATLYLADTLVLTTRFEEARPLLEKALRLNPALGLGHLDLGIVYTEASRNEDALRELQAAEKIMPLDVDVHWRLGRLYRAMGNKDEAKIEFDKASKLNKAADEDLYKKIANGHPKPPETPPVPAPTVK